MSSEKIVQRRVDFDRRSVNLFTPHAFWDIQLNMRHVVTIRSRQNMTRLGGPVEDVAH
jgi:hypothetical protein